MEAEPTVTLIVTEITPEVLVFDENVPVPEVSEDIAIQQREKEEQAAQAASREI